MRIKRMIMVSAVALVLAGFGTFVSNTNRVSASQPVRVFRQTNGRNNHGYCGFYYAKSMDNIGTKIHYQKGLLPKSLRKRNRYVSIWDPAIKEESPIKRGRSRYYVDDLDASQRLSHGKYYQNVLINTNDVHGISNRQDRNILKSIKSQYKRNQRAIKRHRHNHKLIDRLEDQNSFLQVKLSTDNTNNRMKMDPKRRRKAPVKHHVRRHYRKVRKHNVKHNIKRKKRQIHKSNRKNHSKNNGLQINLAEAKAQTLKDINADREANGLTSVQESPEMDRIGALRAKQDENCAGHYDPSTNQPYELEDASKLGINFGKGAETDSNGVTHSYVFTENLAANYGNNGNQVADNANNDMMYHDQDQGNGHRKNILYKPWRYVGIGTAPAKGEYSGDIVIAEEFTDWVGTNPNANNDTNESNN